MTATMSRVGCAPPQPPARSSTLRSVRTYREAMKDTLELPVSWALDLPAPHHRRDI